MATLVPFLSNPLQGSWEELTRNMVLDEIIREWRVSTHAEINIIEAYADSVHNITNSPFKALMGGLYLGSPSNQGPLSASTSVSTIGESIVGVLLFRFSECTGYFPLSLVLWSLGMEGIELSRIDQQLYESDLEIFWIFARKQVKRSEVWYLENHSNT
ncbi:conserved hypothetical protein [Ricinus communis]|uniref:Uncharacterized protein n=1 Tax=Ricinus communis TaxID=3988 RepID=B9SGG1_RICCO|nr:conserved hypothetical protein [Ricinus communis]